MKSFMKRRKQGILFIWVIFMAGIAASINRETSGIAIFCIVVDMVLLSFLVWLDTGGEQKLTDMQNASDLKRIKERFSLEEGELVEVLFTPQDETFTMRMSLSIQQKIETRYFALLEGEEISIIAKVGDKMIEPVKMIYPRTLEWQFTPIVKEE